MLPHQFKRLMELLRGQLGAIDKAIQEQTAADHDTRKAAEIERRDIPRITASLIYPDERKQADATDRQQTHSEQGQLISSQNRTADWTRNACIAAIFYGLIALVQGILMWRTYTQIEQQTTAAQCTAKAAQEQAILMRQQLVGTQAAIIEVGNGPQVGDDGLVSLPLCNRGHVMGHATLHLVAVRPFRQGVAQKIFDAVFPNEPITENCKLFSHSDPWFASNKWRQILSRETATQELIMRGEYAWDDGFGTDYKTPFCYSLMITRGYRDVILPQTAGTPGQLSSPGWASCEQWPLSRHSYLVHSGQIKEKDQ